MVTVYENDEWSRDAHTLGGRKHEVGSGLAVEDSDTNSILILRQPSEPVFGRSALPLARSAPLVDHFIAGRHADVIEIKAADFRKCGCLERPDECGLPGP